MHIHYLALELVLRFQRRLDMLPEYMPSESRKWCWMAQYIYIYIHIHIQQEYKVKHSQPYYQESLCNGYGYWSWEQPQHGCAELLFTLQAAMFSGHHKHCSYCAASFFDNFQQQPLHTIAYHYIPLLCGHIDLFFVDIGGKLWNKVHRDHPWPSVTLRRCRSYTSFGLNRRNSCWNSRKLCPSMAIWDVRRFLWSKSVRCLYIEISGSVKWRFPKMGVPPNSFDV